MTVQQTSLLALAELMPKKALMQRKVLKLLQDCGPMTNKEVSRALGWEINRVTGRMAGAVGMGEGTIYP